ncbi:MAG: peptidase C15 [Leptolyngbyaceae cyanobacterium bins.302]|nr:peptidase C15 [Leptolyngbyaceae cyanobacterium bins.302]
MPSSLLLTSFDIWKTHHTSNASDDLLKELLLRNIVGEPIQLLRKLPVDFELAPKQVIAAMERLQPRLLVCCGMAERRSYLCVESNGKFENETIYTSVDVRKLVQGLLFTRVSHNAGGFVCNHTYYSVLKYIQTTQVATHCIFVHVPCINSENCAAIVADFSTILTRLQASHAHTR